MAFSSLLSEELEKSVLLKGAVLVALNSQKNVLVLLSVLLEKGSVSRMRDFYCCHHYSLTVQKARNEPKIVYANNNFFLKFNWTF